MFRYSTVSPLVLLGVTGTLVGVRRALAVVLVGFFLMAVAAADVAAQDWSSSGPLPPTVAPGLPGSSMTSPAPQTQLVPVPGPSTFATPNPPSVSLGNPSFDPYNGGNAPGVFTPALPYQPAVPPTAAVPGGSTMGSLFSGFTGGASGYTTSNPYPYYGAGPPPDAFAAPSPTANAYPPSVYPNSGPPVLFPGGFMGGGMGATPGGYYNPLGEFSMPQVVKFLQGPRLMHGWLGSGDDGNDLGMNETSVSLAFAFPNFLYSGQPVYILPSFGLDLWDGPGNGTADLPSSAYEAFVDVGWQSDPNQILGLELGMRIGVFTDFDTFNDDSLRILGTALGKFRLTPRATLKAGVMYIDRLEVKLIPAGGILWQPNPYWRWDIYFPEPKVSRYLSTVGTQDVWGYLAGEYGGGSWTITRTSGVEDRVDINDFRVLLGLEWGRSDLIRSGRRTAFIEAGWVFNREIVYESTPGSMEPDSTFILRAGIGY